ncbi:MAG TPA: aquaporin [Patescibacteria group bacterium]|nr:aquaporin [Patescibacteria group bacterium]
MLQERKKIAMIVAEFLGTALLTIVALSVTRAIGNAYFVGIAVGLTMAAMTLVIGKVSGSHLNPAITIGLLTTRKVEALASVVYIAAQLLGGISAYLLYTYFTNQHWSNSGHFESRTLVAEVAGAFVFSLGWASTIYNKYEGGKAAFVIGASLTVGIIVASIVSAGILNPAVALGMRSWGWGTYVLGPVLGAVIGFNLYALLFAPASSLEEKKK